MMAHKEFSPQAALDRLLSGSPPNAITFDEGVFFDKARRLSIKLLDRSPLLKSLISRTAMR